MGANDMPKARLLLVPGLMCDARIWARQIDALQSLAEVSVVDLASADTLTGQARAVITEIGDKTCALAGFSMGGIIAQEVMRLAPEKISRLALWDTNPGPDPSSKRLERNAHISMSGSMGLAQMTREIFAPLYLGHRADTQPDLVDLLVSMAGDLGNDVFFRQMIALRDRHDNWPNLPSIDVPTLVGCGVDDHVCPIDRHREMASRIPTATLVEVPNSGHLTLWEQPETVSVAMRDWLLEGLD
jgi:pimeloyl-ACP methyl ester carboxylesterase